MALFNNKVRETENQRSEIVGSDRIGIQIYSGKKVMLFPPDKSTG